MDRSGSLRAQLQSIRTVVEKALDSACNVILFMEGPGWNCKILDVQTIVNHFRILDFKMLDVQGNTQ
eukprot:698481-Lingulodinium_polyedra.AAC.1